MSFIGFQTFLLSCIYIIDKDNVDDSGNKIKNLLIFFKWKKFIRVNSLIFNVIKIFYHKYNAFI